MTVQNLMTELSAGLEEFFLLQVHIFHNYLKHVRGTCKQEFAPNILYLYFLRLYDNIILLVRSS